MITLADFSLVDSAVEMVQNEMNLNTRSNAFYFTILDLMYSIQEDEIDDSITDNFYLKSRGRSSGHDRGIDAIYIDTSKSRTEINLFNCKYAGEFRIAKNNFPSGEIDKIISFFKDLLMQEEEAFNNCNSSLKQKVNEIWEIYKTENPIINLYFMSNHIIGMEESEFKRIKFALNKMKVNVFEKVIKDFVEDLCTKEKITINGKFRAIGKEFFSKSTGDLKSLICSIDARDLIRLVINNDDIRGNCDFNKYEEFRDYEILEDAFDDNVRIYLKQSNKINKNIKDTALSSERERFFFFNNGITLTCSKLEYTDRTSPVVELEDIQVVNGSQTIHSLYEGIKEDDTFLEDVNLLIRIYETKKTELVGKIAEYTNSQTEVKSRDIRAIDTLQIKLDNEFKIKNYYYERKKNQYQGQDKSKRIDLEKVGQVLLTYYNSMPLEAKNKKSIIFGSMYEEIFDEHITFDRIMVPYQLYQKIEIYKETWKANDGDVNGANGHLAYTSYLILYLLNKFSEINGVSSELTNIDTLITSYQNAIDLIKTVTDAEKSTRGEQFNIYSFFKSKKSLNLIDLKFDELYVENA